MKKSTGHIISILQGMIIMAILMWIGLEGFKLWITAIIILSILTAIQVFLIYPKLEKKVLYKEGE